MSTESCWMYEQITVKTLVNAWQTHGRCPRGHTAIQKYLKTDRQMDLGMCQWMYRCTDITMGMSVLELVATQCNEKYNRIYINGNCS